MLHPAPTMSLFLGLCLIQNSGKKGQYSGADDGDDDGDDGGGNRSANILPDLRRSPTLASKDTWRSIVEDGALQATGMIAWKSFLPEGGAEAIRGYVAGEAKVEAARLANGATQ